MSPMVTVLEKSLAIIDIFVFKLAVVPIIFGYLFSDLDNLTSSSWSRALDSLAPGLGTRSRTPMVFEIQLWIRYQTLESRSRQGAAFFSYHCLFVILAAPVYVAKTSPTLGPTY